MVSLPNNWYPRDYQRKAWMAFSDIANPRSIVNRAFLVWARRHGKDDICLHHNAVSAMERVGNYWYMLPKYKQARKAIWGAVNPHTGKKRIDEAFPHEIRRKTLDQEMLIEFVNGSTWQVMGSDNHDSLVGSPPVGLTFSEYALSNPSSWSYLSPILMENGGWAVFNTTPRGKNHAYKLFEHAKKDPKWFGELLTAKDSGLFSNEDLLEELARLQAEHGPEYGKAIWEQEYFCSFDAAIPGAIWADSIIQLQMRDGLGHFPHTEGYPVFTAWDLGRSDKTVIWFYQMVNDRIRVIDVYSESFKEPEDLALVLKDKAENGYQFGTNWLPHDGFSIKQGMGGKSIVAQLLDCRKQILSESRIDIGGFNRVPDLSREDGIAAARKTFHICDFDTECEEGLEYLKAYHRSFDEEKKVFSTSPVHDESSHYADAFRYLSISWQFAKREQSELSQSQKFQAGNIKNVTFGDMMKQHMKKKRQIRANSY